MDVRLKPFDFNQALARAGLDASGQPIARSTRPAGVAGAGRPAEAASGGFQVELSSALERVSADQAEATRLQRDLSLDDPTVSLEETMVAMQKAQLGFQAVVQVRNRLVSAYTEIMNMQV